MQTRLRIRLGQLSTTERATLMRKLAMSESTFYRKQNDPGSYTWDELIVLKAYLDKLDNADHDMNALRKPFTIVRQRQRA